jgi:hypothetical protein
VAALVGSPALTGTANAESRTITIGIRQASGVYTFSGQVGPRTPGLHVTLARLDGMTKRVTGVSSTKADAAGRYTIRTRLPAGPAGFYALTAPTSDHPPGRSRLYGLVVPTPRLAVESASQRNARLKGAQYLGVLAFSRSGLIKQLQFEGFSLADATYGTDVQNANWMAQAARKAREYLNSQPFSRDGLIRQLEFEGFTRAQAEYGVKHVGLG